LSCRWRLKLTSYTKCLKYPLGAATAIRTRFSRRFSVWRWVCLLRFRVWNRFSAHFKCFLCWHKDCLRFNNLTCEAASGAMTSKTSASAAGKRMSIFGVELLKHLEKTKADIPTVVAACISELEKRGLKSLVSCALPRVSAHTTRRDSLQGLYRVCGVKTKTEELCQQFENDAVFDLSDVPSNNLASVVKLYIRQLPEPLLTHELFVEFMKISEVSTKLQVLACVRSKVSLNFKAYTENQLSLHTDIYPDVALKLIIKKLPLANYNLAKLLLLHLHR